MYHTCLHEAKTNKSNFWKCFDEKVDINCKAVVSYDAHGRGQGSFGYKVGGVFSVKDSEFIFIVL
jgi:hypothetical protein